MDTPIISPVYIYLADMLPKVSTGIIVIAVLAIIAGFITIMCSFDCCEFQSDEEKKLTKKGIKAIIFGSVFVLLALLIPSKETMLTMYVASRITPGTIEASKENVEELVDYIIEKVNEIEK